MAEAVAQLSPADWGAVKAENPADWGAQPVAGSSVIADTVKSLAVGVPKGLMGLAGLPGDLAKRFEKAGDWLGNIAGLPPATEEMKRSQHSSQPASSEGIRKSVESVTGPLYEPQTTPGRYAQTVGEFAPAALAGPGGIARRLTTQALAPAVASEAAGQATEGSALEPLARIGGAVAGGPAAIAAGRLGGAVRNAFSPEANVAADLGRAITRDQTTPQELFQRANELSAVRPGVATVADAGGENVRGLVERIAQTPGAGRTQVVPALTQRQQGQMARIATDLRGLTGTHQSATQAIEETMARRAQAAAPAYEEAMNFNAREVPEIAREWQSITSNGWGQHVLRSPDFRRTLQTEYGIADPTNAPLMTVIDAWKKQADGLIGEAIRSGNNNKARVIGDMRERLLGVVDEHNPAYAAARGAWAGPSRYLDALTEGRNVLSTKISSEELTSALGAMSDAEREAFRIGSVSSIIGKMGSDAAAMGDMTKYLRSPEMRAKIAAIMPTPEARATWAQRLDFEVSSSQLAGRALGNSATARRLAERHDAESIVGDLVMDAFAGSPPVSLLRRAVSAVPQRIRDTLRSRSDHVLAELLTDPQSMAGLRQAIDRVTQASSPTLRSGSVPLATVNAAQASEHSR